MKNRFWIYFSIAVLALLAVLFWLKPKQATTTPSPIPTTFQPTNAPATANTPAVVPPAASLPSVNQSRIVTHKDETPEQVRQEIESVNMPIDIYGMVIDQNSNPVPGVTIKVATRHWGMPDPNVELVVSTNMRAQTVSGADGRFEIHGITGDEGGFILTKDGYDGETGPRGFGGGTSGSYDNPLIFKMWSTNIHEKLITGNYAFHIIPDGRPYLINLTDGTISESGTGDLKVWIQYTNQIKDNQLYNWSAGIDVINGGLEATSDDPRWMAPAGGYVSSFQLAGQIKGYQRGQIGERRFYLQLRNGNEYGQMTINLLAPFNIGIPGLLRLSYAINPSGSRILR